jgi:hypothetical protein
VHLEALASQPRRHLLPLAALLQDLPRAEVGAREEARFRNGQCLARSAATGLCAVYGPNGGVVGLGEARDGKLRPVRLLAPAQAADKTPKSL